MKNIFVSVLIAMACNSAFAGKTVTCSDPAEDAVFSVTFDGVGHSTADVAIFVPTGETAGETYTGQCEADQGADEVSYSCNVFTSTDSGYEIKLFSVGGGSHMATVQGWSMAGDEAGFALPCGAW